MLQFGAKEWTLLPPGRDIYSKVHPLEWIRDGGANAEYFPYKKTKQGAEAEAGAAGAEAGAGAGAGAGAEAGAKAGAGAGADAGAEAGADDDIPCSFTQLPGEVLFLPRHWTHQVLNLAESVGFAVEISDYLY
jgi:hypothetical protein